MIDRLRPARNVAILRLLGAFGLLNVAEWGFVTALSIYAFRVGGTVDVGLIGLRLLAGALSSAMLSPLVIGRRAVLSSVAAIRTTLLGLAAILVLKHASYGVILAAVVLDSVAAACYRPAQARIMPSLARSPAELTGAVAGSSIAKTLGQAAGAMLAGFAIDATSAGATMVGAAAVALAALICGFGLQRTTVTTLVADEVESLRAGLRAFPKVLTDPNAGSLVTAGMLRTLLRGLWGALAVVVALKLLKAGSSGVGFMQAAAGVGAVLALPIIATQTGRTRLSFPCALAFITAGCAICAVAACSVLAAVLGLLCVWGIAMAVSDAVSVSLLFRALDPACLMRTINVMESLKLMSEGVGALLAPGLVALFGVRVSLVIAGAPLPMLMVATWFRIRAADEVAVGRGRLVLLLHGVKLFRGMNMAAIEQLAAGAESVKFDVGAEVIRQGNPGNSFYVVESGEAGVLIDGHEIRPLGPGGGFGERALLRDTPRTATVVATSRLHLYKIQRDAFLTAVTGLQGAELGDADLSSVPRAELLAGIPALASVAPSDLERLAKSARHRRLVHEALILREGDPGDAMYVIVSGRVELLRDGRRASVLTAGEAFGELGVLYHERYTATARALGAVELLSVPAEPLRRLAVEPAAPS